MTTTLSEGVKVPDVGSVNWAGDLEVNWNLLNGALANLSGNVKLDRDNTWTGEQSFTLPIIGSITGTASKAIADEDGTSIKTGYGKLANINTWSTAQVFLNALRFNNTSYVSGTPSENIFYASLQWGGYVNNTWSAPFTINNAIRTNGYSDTSFRTYSQTSNTLTGFVHETNADASDIAFRPIINGTHKLGSSAYQWSSVYAQTYYYNGTAWGLDKANVWTGENTFSSTLKQVNSTVTKGTIPQSDTTAFNVYWGGTGVSSLNNALFAQRGYVNADGSTTYLLYALENASGGTQTQFGLKYDPNDTVNKRYAYLRGDFRPYSNGDYNLGTSTNKWKTLNGINPGALSLPTTDISKLVYFSGDITNLTGGLNSKSFTVDGWITIIIPNVSGNYIAIDTSIGQVISISGTGVGDVNIACICPVRAGITNKIYCKCSGGSLTAVHIPCLGNV